MAADPIQIQDEKLHAALSQLVAHGGDVAGALDKVGAALLSRVQLGFRNSRTPDGKPWAPLKTRQGQPLRDTRHLQNSIGYRTTGQGAEAEMVLGTNVEYAPYHQFGAVIKPVTAKLLRFTIAGGKVVYSKGPIVLPARPFMPVDALPDPWRKKVSAVLVGHLEAVMLKYAT